VVETQFREKSKEKVIYLEGKKLEDYRI